MHPLEQELLAKKNDTRAKISSSFFKTGKGEYGEGDVFIGIAVPELRRLAKKYPALSFKEVEYFLKSPIHEFRFIALIILTDQFAKASEEKKKTIFDFYIQQRKYINNWDLIDCTTPNIIGAYLYGKDILLLYNFAKTGTLWEKRMAILATLAFIRNNKYDETLKIAEMLLNEKHDLLHKAVGWMLREVGKKDQKKEEQFLKKYAKRMPRTMVRYAIERFPEQKRQEYLRR